MYTDVNDIKDVKYLAAQCKLHSKSYIVMYGYVTFYILSL